MKCDVLVVGGGPAGLICAERLAKAGLSVVVADKNETPNKDKPCGGMLTERALREFRISPKVVEREIYGVLVALREGCFHVDYNERVGGNVDRSGLGRYLAERVEEAGGTIVTKERILNVYVDDDYVKGTGKRDYISEFVVFADGVHSLARRVMGWRWRKDQLGLCVQYLVRMNEERVNEVFGYRNHFYYGSDISPFGYGWMFPRRNVVVIGVGALLSKVTSPLKKYLDYLLSKHPLSSPKLRGGEILRFEAALVPLSGIMGKISGWRTIVVGDAAGAVSSITGEGMYYGMKSGLIGAEVVVKAYEEENPSEKRMEQYDRRLKAEIGSDMKWSLWLRNFFMERRSGVVNTSSSSLQRVISDLIIGRKSCKKAIMDALPLVALNLIKRKIIGNR
ncbi:MAG: geranylgeranyl reductase family protein [Candidatus Freyarchaeota archaeon]